MELPVRYLTLPRPKDRYANTKGLSEQLVKRALKKRGYHVTRGSMLDCFFEQTGFDESDNAVFVRWKLIGTLGIKRAVRIAKWCTRRHGTPDFLAAHAGRGLVAVEVKLGQEAVMPHQLETMRKLMAWGVPCEIWRVMPRRNKVREKQIDLAAWSETGDLREATAKKSYERSVTVYGKRRR